MNLINELTGFGFNLLMILVLASSFVLVLAWALTSVLGKASAATRCTIWATALLGLGFVPLGLIFGPKIPLGMPSGVVVINELKLPNADLENMPKLEAEQIAFASAPKKVSPVEAPVVPVVNPQNEGKSSSIIKSLGSPTTSWFASIWKSLLVFFWAIGFCWWLARIFRSVFYANRLTVQSEKFVDFPKSTRLSAQSTRVSIRISEAAEIPLTIGVLRPVILFPRVAEQWQETRIELALAHELAHVQRKDVLWNLLISVCQGLIWFHPLGWLANRKLHLEREKACDDRVLQSGNEPTEYATMLVELGAELSGRSYPVCAMAMAKKPIERRLVSILNPVKSRKRVSLRAQVFLGAVFFVLAMMFAVVQPFQTRILAQDSEGQPPAPTQDTVPGETEDWQVFPDHLISDVKDHQGNPVPNATIVVDIDVFGKGINEFYGNRKYDYEKYKRRATTDSNGRFALDTREIKYNPEYGVSIIGSASAEGQLRTRISHFLEDADEIKLTSIAFLETRAVSGRVLEKDTSNPVENGKVRFEGGGNSASWWTSPIIACDAKGYFKTLVPANMKLAMFAMGSDYVQRKVILYAGDDPGDIELDSGTSILGKVFDGEGNPCAGVVVVIESGLEATGNPGDFTDRSYSFGVKTNENGEFELPPTLGRCHLYLIDGARDRDTQAILRSEGQPPVIAPVKLELDGSKPWQKIDLVQGKLFTVRGKLLWPDGSPAVNATARANIWTDQNGYRVDETFTDENGQYELRVPGAAEVGISLLGAKDASRTWHYAWPNNDVAPVRQTQHQRLGVLNENVEDADWELRER